MTGDCRWNCTRCKTKRDAVKRIVIWKLPPIVIIVLKRYVYSLSRLNVTPPIIIISCLNGTPPMEVIVLERLACSQVSVTVVFLK